MKNFLIVLLLSCSFCILSCDEWLYPQEPHITLDIEPNLPVDVNGYSVFEMYSNDTQNIHTVGGWIRADGDIPNPERQKVEWESSHYWTLEVGDTIGTIYRRTWRGLGWQVVDSILVTNLKKSLVPTINPVCYSESDGEIHTVIAPIWEMRGDTMEIVATSGNAKVMKKIILK
jgi:hypothetical protein